MNDYKELLAELRKCKYCAKDVAKYAADAIEQLVAEYNELDKAHGELFLEYHKVKKQRDAAIADAATVDAVPVVRCKDCKYHEDEEIGIVYCPNMIGGWVRENWFCADGKRKGE